MKRLRSKLTYSNVISTLCLFLLIGGGTAFAASHLGKNSVGSKQLKKNAVTAAKIKKNAVTGAKIKASAIVASKIAKAAVTGAAIAPGAVTGSNIAGGTIAGSNIAGGTITGANINAPSTPFTQAVARLRTSAQQAFGSSTLYPIGSYTQQAGEDDQYLATLTVNFSASCEAPRTAVAFLVRDVSSPPSNIDEIIPNIIGVGLLRDEAGGAVSQIMSFGAAEGLGSMYSLAPTSATNHSISVLMFKGECETGSGITVAGGAVDVLGTK